MRNPVDAGVTETVRPRFALEIVNASTRQPTGQLLTAPHTSRPVELRCAGDCDGRRGIAARALFGDP